MNECGTSKPKALRPDSASPGVEATTPRLQALARLVQVLDDDEFRKLPLVLSEQILERERRRAKSLLAQVGQQCDVLWPGQAEACDVLLASVDAEAGTARVQYAPNGRGLDVPACSIILRNG